MYASWSYDRVKLTKFLQLKKDFNTYLNLKNFLIDEIFLIDEKLFAVHVDMKHIWPHIYVSFVVI